MKAKKILAVMLGAAMVCSLAACGSSSDSNSTTSDGNTQTVETETDDAGETEMDSAAESMEEDETLDLSDQEVTFEETTFIDNEYCKFTVMGITIDEEGCCLMEVKMESRSSDMYCKCRVNAVNGIKHPSGFASIYVEPGEIAYDEFEIEGNLYKYDDIIWRTWDTLGLEWPGYSDLELTLEVENDSSISSEILSTETFHVCPYGEENAMVYEPSESAQVLLDNDYVTITLLNTNMYYGDNDDHSGLYISFYVQSKSDCLFWLESGGNCVINGKVIDIYHSSQDYKEFYANSRMVGSGDELLFLRE